jgi:DNA polymerase-4
MIPSQPARKIIHLDMDAFYASVEQRDRPELRGKPVGVGGLPEERGVLCTASYEARQFGVRSAMSSAKALKLCPQLILIHPDFRKYQEVSDRIHQFCLEHTDLIEPLSLDECFMDVTDNKKNIASATEIAQSLKDRIKNDLHLTASCGVAPNKLLAKIASDMNKPDGLTVVRPGEVSRFISSLPVSRLFGVGKVTLKKMESMGIFTCGDLQKLTIRELGSSFGSYGETLYDFSRGYDDREVIPHHEAKSIGSEVTFRSDTTNLNFIKSELMDQIRIITKRLKNQKLLAKTITLVVKFSDFSRITRSRTLDYSTQDPDDLYRELSILLAEHYDGRKPVRLIGASASRFKDENEKTLFDL